MEVMMNLFDAYCQKRVDGCRAWDVLDIHKTYWSDVKRKGSLSAKIVRNICSELQCPLTEDYKTLSLMLVEKLYD
jgi:hypothetical protein